MTLRSRRAGTVASAPGARRGRGGAWVWAACAVAVGAFAPRLAGQEPAAAQPGGTIQQDYIRSRSLGAEKLYVVYLPPSYATSAPRRYPVAYYLHGARGSEVDWVRSGHVDTVMDSLISAGMPEMIVVMPDGDDGFYTTWAPRYDRLACPLRTDLRESAGGYCVRRPRYGEYIAQELVRHIDATYRTIPDAAHRGIAGLSMGGYGAMALAARYPGVWSAAASHSGALSLLALRADSASGTIERAPGLAAAWQSRAPELGTILNAVFGPDSAEWWARDPVRLLARLAASDRARVPALYADVGTGDLFLQQNRAFHIEVAALGLPLEYREHPGAHDWTYWRAHVGESLSWLALHIAR